MEGSEKIPGIGRKTMYTRADFSDAYIVAHDDAMGGFLFGSNKGGARGGRPLHWPGS